MRAHQAQLAGDVSSFSDRTSAITGFSRPRRARLEGDALGASGWFEIRGGLVRIGRADDNELVLDQAGLDPYHAAIEQTVDFDIYLCDLTRGSRKAPRVNGRSVRRQRLCDGDLITLGRVQLTYRTSNR
jgi:pSer/pThr/pTyr-binding forkhead associated (FHA) protein